MKTVNLLPKSQKKELELEFISHQIVVFWVLVVITLVLFIGIAWVFKFYVAQVIATNDRLISESRKQLASAEYKDLHDQIIALNGSVAEIKNVNTHHYNWSKALLKISDLVQPTIQLNQLNFDATTGKVDITGQAKTRQDVIDLWASIKKSEYFTKINFPLTNLEKPEDANFTYSFYTNKDKFTNPK
jgi:Tfp pilus assembly protein PilN